MTVRYIKQNEQILFVQYRTKSIQICDTMIEVTELAAGELKNLLEQENKQDHALRIFVAGMGCSGLSYGMTLDDTKKDEDLELTSNGVKLLMTSEIQESLDGSEIDYIDNEHGKGFVINNPNAPKCGSGCSC